MRITLLLALASFLAGCGGTSTSIGGLGDSGSGPSCSGTQPSCTFCGEHTSPSCIDGTWECPVLGIACEVDAGNQGDGGCGGQQPSCTFCGEATSPSCIDGTWECPVFGIECPNDAGGGDASFECYGTKTCNAETSYCNVSGGGAVPLDGGSNLTVSCDPLPAMPCEAGTGCACLPDKCSCTDVAGAITNECFYP
jgi:hypothetical protein